MKCPSCGNSDFDYGTAKLLKETPFGFITYTFSTYACKCGQGFLIPKSREF